MVHRDIKPSNVLLHKSDEDNEFPDIRLADFGLAVKLKKIKFGKAYNGGTAKHQAPEQVNAPHLAGPAQDMWSVGAVIHEMALGGPPVDTFKGDLTKPAGNERDASFSRLVARIDIPPSQRVNQWAGAEKKMDTNATASWADTYSPLLNSCMRQCLDFDLDRRATAIDLIDLRSPVYQQVLLVSQSNPQLTEPMLIRSWSIRRESQRHS